MVQPALRIVIPSFNRACQLECLLRSIFDNCPATNQFSICVFHRYTNDSFAEGYDSVKRLYPSVEFVEQSLKLSFKQQLLDLVSDLDFFGWIVDDMVVLNGFGIDDKPFQLLKDREDLFSLSLRLDASKTFSQPINLPASSPKFDSDLIWRWKPKLSRDYRISRFVEKVILKSAFYDWEFPCALDGTVYRTKLFKRFFEKIGEFENIPFIERELRKAVDLFKDAPPNMIRYSTSRSISLAMNSVDEYHDYPSLGLDPEEFNRRFLAGDRLDYSPYKKIVFHACHVVSEPFWLPHGAGDVSNA